MNPLLSSLLKFLEDVLPKALLGLFIYNKGKDAQKLKDTERALEDAKEAKELELHVSNMSDVDKHSVLYDPNKKS